MGCGAGSQRLPATSAAPPAHYSATIRRFPRLLAPLQPLVLVLVLLLLLLLVLVLLLRRDRWG
jgi:hypothetical protein